jgi:hypothetical protein
MAQGKKPKAGAKKKQKAAAPGRALVATKPKKSRQRQSDNSSGFDGLTRLIEHPLVAELISVAAIAAVAAIADHNVKTRTGEGSKGSKKALKAAGTAAAAAIGKRLASEFEEIRKASKKAGG